jgi:biopolymer transport protein TolQ
VSFDLISLILQAGLIVKLVLLLLLGFSLTSLTIIVTKWWELRAADQDSEAFLEVYRREGFSHAYDAARHLDRSPLAVVFLATGDELHGARARLLGTRRTDVVLKELERSIAWTASAQARRLERGMPFLATTGSSAPFIGLFGTVVGIIAAFQSIGEAGQASLAVVGPGIAEALVATAVGLLAAIPATIAYNTYASRIDVIVSMLDRFTAQFEEDLSRIVEPEHTEPIGGSGGDASEDPEREGAGDPLSDEEDGPLFSTRVRAGGAPIPTGDVVARPAARVD